MGKGNNKGAPARRRLSEQNQIRIIAGDWRGRKLPVLSAEGLRPTTDRMRETLFNWLAWDLAGAHCLDLYAGSGALSFEALSRGAQNAYLIELNPNNAQQLQQNLQTLDVHNAWVVATNALTWLEKVGSTLPNHKIDIVFIDPPFYQGLVQASLDALFCTKLLSPQACIYIEQEKSLAWPRLPLGWSLQRSKQTAQTQVALIRPTETI